MSRVTVNKADLANLVRGTADFINAATPFVEKQAAQQEALIDFAEKAANAMSEAGLINAKDVNSVAKEMVDGGFSKVSEAFDFVIRQLEQTKQANFTMGSAADEDAKQAAVTADDLWESGFGLR